MNGAIDKLTHIANLRRRATTRRLLVRVGAPAMAVVGVGAIAAILVGLQCGGLDKCLAGARQATLTHAAPTAVLPAAPQAERAAIASAAAPVAAPAAPVAAPGASVAPAAPVAALTEVAMTRTPAVPEGVQRAQRVDQMIGNTFVALASDDAGWLAGATANAAADAETYAEGDGAGPPPQIGETAAEAADAIATGEAPVAPLQRPTPLDVTAFADAPSETAATVRAEAERKLAEVAKSQPEPEPEPKAAEPKAAEPKAAEPKAAEPQPAKAQAAKAEAAAAGDTRTVVGSGVNVRSGPGKSNGRAFGLAGGEKVTVGENRRGWLKITDDQGRTGWVYKDYLN
jgi:hypothetical protein